MYSVCSTFSSLAKKIPWIIYNAIFYCKLLWQSGKQRRVVFQRNIIWNLWKNFLPIFFLIFWLFFSFLGYSFFFYSEKKVINWYFSFFLYCLGKVEKFGCKIYRKIYVSKRSATTSHQKETYVGKSDKRIGDYSSSIKQRGLVHSVLGPR